MPRTSSHQVHPNQGSTNRGVRVIGRQIGPYQIVDKLGEGGMGEVYRARDARLNRDVALKVLPEIFARDMQRMARFEREAKLLASLNHPNIAAIYGLEESGSTRALVMELVEGPTLADRIRSGAIPMEEALPLARQIADAFHQVVMLGAGTRDADGVGLLEGIVADEMGRHLAGQADNRDGIHQGVGQTGHRVGRAGAGGHQHCAHLAGGACIAFGGMDSALLMTDQHMAQCVLLEQLVIDRKYGAARIAENDIDALIHQSPNYHLRAIHLFVRHNRKPFQLNNSFARLVHPVLLHTLPA